MTKAKELIYTQTYLSSLERSIAYLSQDSDLNGVIDRVLKVQEKFEARVTDLPLSCPCCAELVELGVTDCREYNVANFRILYTFNEAHGTVTALVFMRQRQSIRKLMLDLALF